MNGTEKVLKDVLHKMTELSNEQSDLEDNHMIADILLTTTIAALSHNTEYAEICKEIKDKYSSLEKWYA